MEWVGLTEIDSASLSARADGNLAKCAGQDSGTPNQPKIDPQAVGTPCIFLKGA